MNRPVCRPSTASLSLTTATGPSFSRTNGARKQARRYHWLSEGLKSFVDDPHAAIDGKGQGDIVNLADRRAEASRRTQLDLLSSLGPDKIAREYSALETRREQQAKPSADQPLLPHLIMPAHHDVRGSDVIARRLHGNLAAAADRGPKDFPDLLLTPGVGARTVQALAMVAEVMNGAPCRFTDPARFSISLLPAASAAACWACCQAC